MTVTLTELTRLAPVSRRRLAGAVLLGALTLLLGIALMALAGYLISRAAERPAILSLMVVMVGVRFCGLGRPIARYAERLASHDLALRALGQVRAQIYERIIPLAPAQLECYRRGDLLTRMVADVDALQSLYLWVLEPILIALLVAAVSVGVAAAVLPAAGLTLAAGLLVAGVAVPALAAGVAAHAGRRQSSARAALAAELVDLLAAGPELVVLGAGQQAMTRVRSADGELVRLGRRDSFAAGMADGLTLAITGLTVCGVLAAAASASGRHTLDPLLIASLGLLALASFEAVSPLSRAARELTATRAAGGRVLELVDQKALVTDPAAPVPLPQWPFSVALEGVRARYPGQRQAAVNRLNLRLDAGERVALVGPSGAGKTTVANLLLRFLDPEDGCVILGERDLRDYAQEDVRRAITLAGQDAHLFETSIRHNVALGRPGVSDRDIEDVLRRARIWDWVSALPRGVDTQVGELGRELSGGQRQRIAIARALLSDAPVLILDEPTAHLDPPIAEELVRDIMSAADGRTVLLITHRSEGLDLVDRIIPLTLDREEQT
jgi:thiol reductant ABC exporter CydC subunit